MTVISKGHEVVTKLIPGTNPGLAHLSDEDLLANTRRLVGKTNQLFAALLAHLAEVEARGIHRTRRCASLYTYCIYELRFSEDAAARRSTAARLVREFPPLFDAIANGELHLTGLLMIGPHLTSENFVDVLGRAKFRTKKELGRLLRELNPLPQVPDRLEPLGPASPRALRNPTWEEYVTSLSPVVRELPTGERPRDWANDGELASASAERACMAEPSESAPQSDAASGLESAEGEPLPVGPVPQHLPPLAGPQHYQIQFTTVEEHAHLVERAKALLARSRPGITLGELHLEAMKLLVASLEKRKFAVTGQPPARKTAPRRHASTDIDTRQRGESDANTHIDTRQRGESDANTHIDTRQRGESDANTHIDTRQRGESDANTHIDTRQRGETDVDTRRRGETDTTLRRRSRYVPAAERRAVYQRDAGRCTYVDARGERCCETRCLELHHLLAFAKQGENVATNLTLRCPAHHALAAEDDFGAKFVARRRDAARHEALAAQSTAS